MNLDTYTAQLAATQRRMNAIRLVGLAGIAIVLAAYLLAFHVIPITIAVAVAMAAAIAVGIPLQLRAHQLRKAIATLH